MMTNDPFEARSGGGASWLWITKRAPTLVAMGFVTLAIVFAGPSVCDYVAVAGARLLETDPIQWLEPLFYKSALRSYEGGTLFAPPDVAYIAPISGPGIGWGGGWMFHLFGPGFPALRVLVYFTIILLCGVGAVWTSRVARSLYLLPVFPVMLLTLDSPLNLWFTQVNTDIPFLTFVVLGLALLHDDRGTWWLRPVLAGTAMAIATLFKQHAIVFVAVATLTEGFFRPRRGLAFLGGALAILLPTLLFLQWHSEGWFWTIAVGVPLESLSKPDPRTLFHLWRVAPHAVIAFVVALPLLLILEKTWSRRGYWVGVAIAAVVVAVKSFAKDGAAANNLLSFWVVGLLMASIAAARLYRRLQGAWWKTGVVASALIAVSAAGSLGFKQIRPRAEAIRMAAGLTDHLPTGAFHGFEEKLRSVIREAKGEVFVGARPNLLFEAGRPQNFHQTTLLEGTRRCHLYDTEAIVGRQVAERHWQSMIVWDYGRWPFADLLQASYRKRTDLGRDPLIGSMVSVWVPKAESLRAD